MDFCKTLEGFTKFETIGASSTIREAPLFFTSQKRKFLIQFDYENTKQNNKIFRKVAD